jgi:hypothetical protein
MRSEACGHVIGQGAQPTGTPVVVVDADVVGAVVSDVGPSPPHGTPFSTKFAGTEFLPLDVAWNPNWTLAPVASEPFHGMLDADTQVPDCFTLAPHPELITWFPVNDQMSVHVVIGVDWLVTVTLAVNPVDHGLS